MKMTKMTALLLAAAMALTALKRDLQVPFPFMRLQIYK